MTVTPDTLGRLTLLAITSADIFASPDATATATATAAAAAAATGVRELAAVPGIGTGAATTRPHQPLLPNDTEAAARLLRKCHIAVTVHLGMAINLQYEESGMTMSLEMANQVFTKMITTTRTRTWA
jgi:hypothetical protein